MSKLFISLLLACCAAAPPSLVLTKSTVVTPGTYGTIYVKAPTGANIVIDRCTFVGPGDCITQESACNLVVSNCMASTASPGKFVIAWRGININISHNVLNGTGGVLVCNDAKSAQSVVFDCNKGNNITGATGKTTYEKTSFFQVQDCTNLVNSGAHWNHFEGTSGVVATEDAISVMNSSGTPGSRFEIANNFVRGVYAQPGCPATQFSGSAIMCFDPGGAYGVSFAANVYCHDNQVLNCQNQFYVMAGSSGIEVCNNRAFNNPASNPHVTIGYQAFNWDNKTNGGFGANSNWHDNLASVGKNNYSFQAPVKNSNNATMTTSEDAELTRWVAKCNTNKICVGPVPAN
jgi:hypothetical protein